MLYIRSSNIHCYLWESTFSGFYFSWGFFLVCTLQHLMTLSSTCVTINPLTSPLTSSMVYATDSCSRSLNFYAGLKFPLRFFHSHCSASMLGLVLSMLFHLLCFTSLVVCSSSCSASSWSSSFFAHSFSFISINHFCYQKFFYWWRAFVVTAVSAWNKLPQDIRSATSLPVFRRRLKTLLFDMAYNC